MSSVSMIRAMRAAGIDDAKIVDTLIEAEEYRLAGQRARTAKHRTNKKHGKVTGVTGVTLVIKKEPVSPRPPSEERNPPPSAPKGASVPPLDADFEKLWLDWQAYKTAKGAKNLARSEWDRHVRKAGLDPGMVVNAAAAYCEECGQTDTNTQNVHRWIKYHRWNDERLPIKQNGKSGNAQKRTTEDRRREMLEGLRDAGKLDPGLRPAAGDNT